MKRVISLILSLAMVFSFATTAFAAMEGELTGGEITITNAVVGEEYKAYQILYIESYNADADAYTYKATTDWNAFITSADIKDVYVNVDDQGYVTWVKDADPVTFAKLAQKYAEDNSIDPAVDAVTATTTTVAFTGLKLGYYLVDTTMGTLCSLDTTNPTVEMDEKNTPPTIFKDVEEDSTGVYGDNDDAEIGQVVNFKTTVNVTTGAFNYVVHDRMTEGLSFNKVDVVTLNGTPVDAADYEVSTTPTCTCDWDTETEGTQGCTFTVTFAQDLLDTLETGDTLVIYYSATVNDKAVIYPNPNVNETDLTYGNKGRTEKDFTETFVYKFDLIKVDGETMEKLTGAEFELHYAGENDTANEPVVGDKIDVVKDGNVYRFAVEGETGVKIEAGETVITGLDDDGTVYYLVETQQPLGYNKLKDPIRIVMDDNNKSNPATYKYTPETADEYAGILVMNQRGAELPSTGGMGTTLFYIVGAVMVLGSAVVFVTKKRMGETE